MIQYAHYKKYQQDIPGTAVVSKGEDKTVISHKVEIYRTWEDALKRKVYLEFYPMRTLL